MGSKKLQMSGGENVTDKEYSHRKLSTCPIQEASQGKFFLEANKKVFWENLQGSSSHSLALSVANKCKYTQFYSRSPHDGSNSFHVLFSFALLDGDGTSTHRPPATPAPQPTVDYVAPGGYAARRDCVESQRRSAPDESNSGSHPPGCGIWYRDGLPQVWPKQSEAQGLHLRQHSPFQGEVGLKKKPTLRRAQLRKTKRDRARSRVLIKPLLELIRHLGDKSQWISSDVQVCALFFKIIF